MYKASDKKHRVRRAAYTDSKRPLHWAVLFCHCSVTKACLTLQPHDCSLPASSVQGFPQQNTGVGCHFLLQEIFSDQILSPCFLHCQVDSLSPSHLGSPGEVTLGSDTGQTAVKNRAGCGVWSGLEGTVCTKSWQWERLGLQQHSGSQSCSNSCC